MPLAPKIKTRLKDISYFGCGGPAMGVFTPASLEELKENLAEVRDSKAPYFFLGGGSNSLISDRPYPGHVISAANLNHLTFEPPYIRCGAGVLPSDFAARSLESGLCGGAWLNGLPGQLGGATRMNARCYGSEMAQIVCEVSTINLEGRIHQYQQPEKVFFGYKDTYFMEAKEFIYEIRFQLSYGNPDHLARQRELLEFCLADRTKKGQFNLPSCGCVFKNNYDLGIPSGKLLDLAGLKGKSYGNAEVSAYHANFIFNHGASAWDILELSFIMRKQVYDTFGIWLEYEMEFLGDFSTEQLFQIQSTRPRLSDIKYLMACKDARQEWLNQGDSSDSAKRSSEISASQAMK